METIAKDIDSDRTISMKLPAAANANRRPASVSNRSIFPPDAVARIFRPSRSVMTSGRARTKRWRLAFERRTPPYIEPLMGWTGGDDTLAQIELNFPTLEAAIAYAERQGLAYRVEGRFQAFRGGLSAPLHDLRQPSTWVALELAYSR